MSGSNLGLRKNTSGYGRQFSIVPMVYTFYVLKKIFDSIGYEISGEWWNDNRMKGLAMYNNVSLDSKGTGYNARLAMYQESTIANEALITPLKMGTDAPGDWYVQNGVVLEYGIGLATVWKDRVAGDVVLLVSLVFSEPMGDSGTIAQLILRKNGVPFVTVTIPGGSTSFTKSYEIAGTGSLDEYDFLLTKSGTKSGKRGLVDGQNSVFSATLKSAETYNTYKSNINIVNHVWDVPAIEFIGYWRDIFALDVKINVRKKTVSFDYLKDLVKSKPSIDITDLVDGVPDTIVDTKALVVRYEFENKSVITKKFEGNLIIKDVVTKNFPNNFLGEGLYAFSKVTNTIYKSFYYEVSGFYRWGFFGYYYPDKVYGNGSAEKLISISPCLMSNEIKNYYGDVIDGDYWTVHGLHVYENGNSVLFDMEGNDYHKQFFLYEGLINKMNDTDTTTAGYGYGHTTGLYGHSSQLGDGEDGEVVPDGTLNFSYVENVGMWEEFLKPIYDIITRYAETEFNIKITSADIQNLRDADVLLYKNMKYYAKSNSLRITKSGVEAVLKTILANG